MKGHRFQFIEQVCQLLVGQMQSRKMLARSFSNT